MLWGNLLMLLICLHIYLCEIQKPLLQPDSSILYSEATTVSFSCDEGWPIASSVGTELPLLEGNAGNWTILLVNSTILEAFCTDGTNTSEPVVVQYRVVIQSPSSPVVLPESGSYLYSSTNPLIVTMDVSENETDIDYIDILWSFGSNIVTLTNAITYSSPIVLSNVGVYIINARSVKNYGDQGTILGEDTITRIYKIQKRCKTPKISSSQQSAYNGQSVTIAISALESLAEVFYSIESDQFHPVSPPLTITGFNREVNLTVYQQSPECFQSLHSNIRVSFVSKISKPIVSPTAGSFYYKVDISIACNATEQSTPRVVFRDSNLVFEYNVSAIQLSLNRSELLDISCFSGLQHSSNSSNQYEIISSIATPAPFISPETSTYIERVSVSLNCSVPGAEIWYTTEDLNDELFFPGSANLTLYQEAFTITEPGMNTVRAISSSPHYDTVSEIEQQQYFVIGVLQEPKFKIFSNEDNSNTRIYTHPVNVSIYSEQGASIRYCNSSDHSKAKSLLNSASYHGNTVQIQNIEYPTYLYVQLYKHNYIGTDSIYNYTVMVHVNRTTTPKPIVKRQKNVKSVRKTSAIVASLIGFASVSVLFGISVTICIVIRKTLRARKRKRWTRITNRFNKFGLSVEENYNNL